MKPVSECCGWDADVFDSVRVSMPQLKTRNLSTEFSGHVIASSPFGMLWVATEISNIYARHQLLEHFPGERLSNQHIRVEERLKDPLYHYLWDACTYGRKGFALADGLLSAGRSGARYVF